MIRNLLFIAPVYNKKNIKDGMFQRIKSIDDNLHDKNRVYLNIKFYKFFVKKTTYEGENILAYDVNLFFHLVFICRQIKNCDLLFFHSIYNVIKIFPFFLLFNKKTVLDVHGLVPEELKVLGKGFRSTIFGFIERVVFNKISLLLFVTESMADYFKAKYPKWNGRYKIYYINPSSLSNQKVLLNEPSEKINVIYSGNTQEWQNIDLMLQVIKNNLSTRINYLILTGDVTIVKDKIKAANIEENIIVKSVNPKELAEYYNWAHYGFILRDDIPVNRVANPTKLIEYLYYGITPIIKSPHIGDFMLLNYNYISYQDFSENSPAVKSEANHIIATNIVNKYNPLSILQEIFSELS